MTLQHFRDYCELRGWKQTGTKKTYSIKLREEIEGQPIYDKLAGPMYDGEGQIRYEDWESYEQHSR
jgi:hypothetical protein